MINEVKIKTETAVTAVEPEVAITTAVIKIAPAEDTAIKALFEESQSILRYAESRVIIANEDLNLATEDLSLIANLKKAIEEKRNELEQNRITRQALLSG